MGNIDSTNIFNDLAYQVIKNRLPIDDNIRRVSMEYAEKVTPSTLEQYRQRAYSNPPSPEKIKKDHFTSKVSEFVTRDHCRALTAYEIIKDVDVNIYSSNNKNWSPDLILKHIASGMIINIGCKCSHTKYGEDDLYDLNGNILGRADKQFTFTFQEEDRKYKANYKSKEGEIDIVFMICCLENVVGILGWANNDILQKLFINPLLKKYWIRTKTNGTKSGKKCIMQKTCGTANGFPCGFEELPTRYENCI